MTGLPDFNYPAFNDAEDKLRELGWLVANPAHIRTHPGHLEGDAVWNYYIRQAIPMLLSANDIALLPGWQDSKGAKLELLIAQNLRMPTWDYREGILHEPGTTPPLDALGVLPANYQPGGV